MSDADEQHPWAGLVGAGGTGLTEEELEAWEEAESQRTGSADTDADDADEAQSDDEGDGSEDMLKFVCGVCGDVTSIETPKRKTDHWCRGECDAFRTFYREDHFAVNPDENQ
jgi:hypothetical protein